MCKQIATHTSNLRGAGTDANVFVELIGDAGISSGRLALSSPNPETFEAGRVDTFQVTNCALCPRSTICEVARWPL